MPHFSVRRKHESTRARDPRTPTRTQFLARSAGTRNPPKQNENLDKPENKQFERNRDRRHACRDTSSRSKSKVLEADDHTSGPGNHRGATASGALGPHSPNIDRKRYLQPTYDDTDYTYSTLLSRQQSSTVPEHGQQQKNTKKCSALRRMLRLIIQTIRKYKNKEERGEEDIRDDEISEDNQEEDSTHDQYDQDSSISFDDDEDSTASQEDDLEARTEYFKKEPRKKLTKKCRHTTTQIGSTHR